MVQLVFLILLQIIVILYIDQFLAHINEKLLSEDFIYSRTPSLWLKFSIGSYDDYLQMISWTICLFFHIPACNVFVNFILVSIIIISSYFDNLKSFSKKIIKVHSQTPSEKPKSFFWFSTVYFSTSNIILSSLSIVSVSHSFWWCIQNKQFLVSFFKFIWLW